MLRRDCLPLFVTLTYPAQYSDNPADWKNNLDNLASRLHRKFPQASFVWRLEFQKRGAPHYHLLVYGIVLDLQTTRAWFARAWYEVVGSGDVKHLQAGTQADRCRDWRGVVSYAAKYLGKLDAAEHENVGRWWGAYRRENLPYAVHISLTLYEGSAVKLLRYMRRFARLPGRVYKSLTVMCDASSWVFKLPEFEGG